MLSLPLYFISDNHFKMEIDQPEKNRRGKLYHVFEKIKTTGGTLVIGGDFFDFWFDYQFVLPNGYVDLLEALAKLNQSGIKIHFVLGNHDYWDFGYFKAKFGATVYTGDMDFTIKGKKIKVTHGDGLLLNDRSYRFMRKVIRSRFCIFLFKNFHPDWGCGLARRVSRASGEYHHHDKHNEMIRSELIQYARNQWSKEVDTVLIGHYHQLGVEEDKGKSLIFMGDWLRHFSVTRLDDSGWWQGSWDEL